MAQLWIIFGLWQFFDKSKIYYLKFGKFRLQMVIYATVYHSIDKRPTLFIIWAVTGIQNSPVEKNTNVPYSLVCFIPI